MDNQDNNHATEQAARLDDFKVIALLADYASLKNGLLYILGGGVSRINVLAGSAAPYIVQNLGLGTMVSVPWSKTNTDHTFSIRLVDEDSQSVFLPTGDGSVVPARADLPFIINRPEDISPGTEQQYPIAFNFPNSTFPKLGVYVFLLLIDDVEYERLTVHVVEQR